MGHITHMTLTMPLLGMIHHSQATTWYSLPIY